MLSGIYNILLKTVGSQLKFRFTSKSKRKPTQRPRENSQKGLQFNAMTILHHDHFPRKKPQLGATIQATIKNVFIVKVTGHAW